jgi:hypothetical protein
VGPIRVLFVHLPGMLSAILRRGVAGQADMTVAGELGDLSLLALIERATAPDIVIVGLEDGKLAAPCVRLLETCPHVRILVVAAGGRVAALHGLASEAIPVREVSVEGLLSVIRTVGHPLGDVSPVRQDLGPRLHPN